MSVLSIAQFQARSTKQVVTTGSAAIAAPSSVRFATGLPKRHEVFSVEGSQSLIFEVGVMRTGVLTWMVDWNTPWASNCANSGAMWFIVEWQLAQMTAEVSWKFT